MEDIGKHGKGSSSGPSGSQLWLGVWESTDRSERFDDFLREMGVSVAGNEGQQKTFQTLRREGDDYFEEITVHSMNYHKQFHFRMDAVEYDTKFGSRMKYEYHEDGQGLRMEGELLNSGTKFDTFWRVDNNELVKAFRAGDVVAERWFIRAQPHPTPSS